MIGYGCTPAPYYDHDTRCPGDQGFHHGIDVAMPCGTPLFSAVRGVVLDPSASGSPGSAYGERPFRIRTADRDVLIGHARRVFVEPGTRCDPVSGSRSPPTATPRTAATCTSRCARRVAASATRWTRRRCCSCPADPQAPWRRRPKVRLSSSALQDASITLCPTPTVTHELSPSEVSISTRVIASVPCPWSRMRTL